MKRKLLVALMLIVSMAGFAQETDKNYTTECLNRYWQISLRGGYDFKPFTHGFNKLDIKGAPSFGLSIDHYWKWFGIGIDGDYISNKTELIVDEEIKDKDFQSYQGSGKLKRMFIGIGPSFRLPASCCPRFTAELNTRVGVGFIKSDETSFQGSYDQVFSNGYSFYRSEKIDAKRLSAKAQLRLTYFVNKWLGLNVGGYYLHTFNVPFADGFEGQYGTTVDYKITTNKKALASAGVFAGLSFRICANKKVPLPPVVIPEPEPVPTDYTLQGRVTVCDTDMPVGGATVTVKNITTGTTKTIVTNNNGYYSMTVKASDDLTLQVTKEAFLPSEIKKVNAGEVDPVKVKSKDVNFCIVKPKQDVAIRLDNIYYDFDKSFIREDAKPELDRLVKFLADNPGIRVELSSHTDSRGSDTYNMNLSQRRADAAKSYIVSQGIDASRIVSVGYGESKLLNKCGNGVKCSEAEHQLNRRTEFKIVK